MGVLGCRQRDMTRGWTGVVLWCLPVVALVASAPMGDARWWIWTPSLIIMGTACVANAARCGRRHCYLTGPVLLAATGLAFLRGAFRAGPSWTWISGVVILGWIADASWSDSSNPIPTTAETSTLRERMPSSWRIVPTIVPVSRRKQAS